MSEPRHVWYVAYGSNTAAAGLARYLPRPPEGDDARWVTIPHALFFAGRSRRWEGGVAFVTLSPALPGSACRGRAYRVSVDGLEAIARGENGLAPIGWPPDIAAMPVGGWSVLRLPASRDVRLGKYDALLRVPDIDGAPALTLTTSRDLPRRPPGDAYLAACRSGLMHHPDVADVDGYLAAARARSAAGPG